MSNMTGRMPTRGIQNPIATKVEVESLPIPSGAATSDNQTNGNQISQIKHNPPTNANNINPSFVLTRNASNYITSIAQTIGATTYTKTITRDGSNIITAISAWT